MQGMTAYLDNGNVVFFEGLGVAAVYLAFDEHGLDIDINPESIATLEFHSSSIAGAAWFRGGKSEGGGRVALATIEWDEGVDSEHRCGSIGCAGASISGVCSACSGCSGGGGGAGSGVAGRSAVIW